MSIHNYQKLTQFRNFDVDFLFVSFFYVLLSIGREQHLQTSRDHS